VLRSPDSAIIEKGGQDHRYLSIVKQ